MDDLSRAKEILKSDGCTCALVRGDYVKSSSRNGIAPLLELTDDGVDKSGGSVADKIVGKAAALLYALMGVKRVYAEVLSVAGREVLNSRGIYVEYATLTDKILNRKGDGMCPMEQAVKDCSDPVKAREILSATLEKLRKG